MKDEIIFNKKAIKVFQGKIYSVYQWPQKLYDGTTATFEGLVRPDTVVAIPVTESKKVVMIKEKQPGKEFKLTLPGGRVESNEPVLEAVQRELLEETGLKGSKPELLLKYSPVSKIRWEVFIFVIKNCKQVTKQNLDAGEKIELKLFEPDDFINHYLYTSNQEIYFSNFLLRKKLQPGEIEKFKSNLLS